MWVLYHTDVIWGLKFFVYSIKITSYPTTPLLATTCQHCCQLIATTCHHPPLKRFQSRRDEFEVNWHKIFLIQLADDVKFHLNVYDQDKPKLTNSLWRWCYSDINLAVVCTPLELFIRPHHFDCSSSLICSCFPLMSWHPWFGLI